MLGIRTKIFLAFLVFFAGVGWLESFLVRREVAEGYNRLEMADARRDMTRISESLGDEIQHLDELTRDWSQWDELYAFARNGNTAFAKANLSPLSLQNASLGFVVVYGHQGRVMHAAGWNLQTKHPIPLHALTDPSNPYVKALQGTGASRPQGLILLDALPYAVSSRPIFRADGGGACHGWVLMGRALDPAKIRSLRSRTKLAFTLESGPVPADASIVWDIIGTPTPLGESHVHVEVEPEAYGLHWVFKDVLGNPIGRVVLPWTRSISAGGAQVIRRAKLLVVATTLLAAGLLLVTVIRMFKAQQALWKSENLHQSLLEQMDEGLIAADIDRVITFINPRMAEMLGYAPQELVGRPYSLLLTAEGRERDLRRLEQRKQGQGERYELQLLRKDGRLIDCLVSGSPMRNREGRIAGTLGVFTDITERKRAQRELERLSIAIEQTSEAILITNVQGIILYVNPACQSLTGFNRTELLGANIRTIQNRKQNQAFHLTPWDRVLQGEGWSGHLVHQRADGTPYETITTLSPVHDGEGKIVYLVNTFKDMTREVELEAQLRHAQRMEAIGVLAGGIAHDFNNILTPILGYAEMAMAQVGNPTRTAAYLEEISAAGRRAAELIKRILTFSRQTEQEKKPVLVQPVLKESLKLLRAAIPATISIQLTVEDQESYILGDPSQLHQVIMNLCTNAFHAMRDKGGVLGISLDTVQFEQPRTVLGGTLPAGAYLRLQISDTGHGLDKELLGKIFLPFFTTKKIGEGTGLGLSITSGIVLGFGGGMAVESRVNEGSTFTVYLPRFHADAKELVLPAEELPRGHERILVLDDEASIGNMLGDSLTMAGYRVTPTTSASWAIQRLRNAPGDFDLVLTDLTMPGQTGLDVAEAIHALRPGLPVILMTGHSEGLDEDSIHARHISAMVQKPIALKALARLIREILDQAGSGGLPPGSPEHPYAQAGPSR